MREVLSFWYKTAVLVLLLCIAISVKVNIEDLVTAVKEKQIILKIETFQYDVTANPGSYIILPKETK